MDALAFMIAASGLTTGVDVEVTDDNPTITGKTAYTLTFKGRANETYKYQELDAQGTPTGNVINHTYGWGWKSNHHGSEESNTISDQS